MAKKQKKEKVKKVKPAAGENAEGTTSKKGGLLGQIALGLALTAASFGTVMFIPGQAPPVSHEAAEGEHAKEVHEPLDLTSTPAFVELSPFMISLDGGNSLLRIGITLEANEDSSYLIDPDDPQLRDAFTGYLRALKPAQIRDAAYMARLRAQLLRRARLVFGTDAIYGVLITDFLVQ